MAEIKASYNKERLCLGKEIPLDTPLSLHMDISEQCNFKCSYCFRSKKKDEAWGFAAKNNLMPMEIFRRSVDQLTEFPQRVKSIFLSGHGEPLCHPDIVSMVRHLKESAVTDRIEMHTNASLLTEKRAEEIAQVGFTKIVVSLQGLSADTYYHVCGAKLDWNAFYRHLCILYKSKDSSLKIHIKISEAALSKEYFEADKERFYSLFGPIADTVSIEKVTPLWKNLEMDLDSETNKYGQKVGAIECCPIMFYKIWVAPDGEIYPCTGLPMPLSLGNIQKISLLDAWNGEKRQKFLAAHLRSSRGGHPVCKDCFVPVNTITTDDDRIDPYRKEILERLEEPLDG